MNKKLTKTLSCAALALIAGTALVGCTPANDAAIITGPTDYYTQFSGSDKAIKFWNDDDFKLEYKGLENGVHKYVASGEANEMTQLQATTWGATTGDKYVVLRVNLGAGNQAKIGWTSTPETALGEVDGTIIKTSQASATGNGWKPYILDLRHSDKTSWRYEVQADDNTEAAVHVVDFSAFFTAQ